MAETTERQHCVNRISALYEQAFKNDPVIRYLLNTFSEEARIAYLREYFNSLLTAASLNDAVFSETDECSSAMVLMPPEKRVDNIWTMLPAGVLSLLWKAGIGTIRKMLFDYEPMTEKAKARGLNGQTRYYYVFFIATAEDSQGQGLASKLIRMAQKTAQDDNVPLWLEVTTEKSAKLYASLGFETVEVMVLGKGKSDSDGYPQQGGKGVSVHAMVWQSKP